MREGERGGERGRGRGEESQEKKITHNSCSSFSAAPLRVCSMGVGLA